MHSIQKIIPKGNDINIPLRTQLKESDKNSEFTLLPLFSLFHPSYFFFSHSSQQAQGRQLHLEIAMATLNNPRSMAPRKRDIKYPILN
jgi:hypothetical protein